MLRLSQERLVNGVPDQKTVEALMRAFEAGSHRLNRLARYFEGRHDILARTRLTGLPNSRVVHAFPRYIAQVSASYLLGEPVGVSGPEPGTTAFKALMQTASADSVDIELALHQAIYGRAVSLCYEDPAGQAFVCSLDPRNAFVVYDDTVAADPLFGVYLTGSGGDRACTVYTHKEVIRFGKGGQVQRQPHPFLSLPMVEYYNGVDGHGDFEDVLALIDAYNLLQADRINDRQQFSDALLVLTGVMGIGMAEGEEGSALERLREEKTLALPDSDARAEWLTKTPQEQDIEVLRTALAQDIHKFSLTPDFSDERFAGNASGIAIKYKLFNFDNRIKLKERYFVTGLRERARAFCGWLYTRQRVHLDADQLRFRLSRRLPVNELERAQTLRHLQEIVPRDTLAYNSPLMSHPDEQGVVHQNK